MFIDLTCPAEVFGTVLPTEEVPAAALTLFNLSDRVIVSAEVALRLLDKHGAELEKGIVRLRGSGFPAARQRPQPDMISFCPRL